MSHLDEATLTALLDGELAAVDRQQAEQHLAGCAECRRLHEEVRGFAGEADLLIDSLQLAERTPQRPGRPAAGEGWDRFRPLAWAATLVIAAGLGWSASARRFDQGDLGAQADGLAEEKAAAAPTAPALAPEGGTERPLQYSRERVAPRQDDSPRRQASEPPEPVTTDMAKAAVAAPYAEADQARNAVGRAESAVRSNPPAAALAADPVQARAAEPPGRRDIALRTNLYRVVSLEQAVQILGGTVKLVDGLTPTGVGIRPPQLPGEDRGLEVVRITYLDPPGRQLWLDQQRSPRPSEGPAAPAAAGGILAGDTLITSAGDGLNRVHWISPDGFRLTLTGYLPADSLRVLVRRVH